ncbi:MAG: hypothetical protein V8T12_05800 [Parabacteroides johnsonii]
MQGGGRKVSFQVGGDIVLLVIPEYQVGLDGTDRRRELAESDQVIEEAGDLTGKIDRA